MTTPEVLDGAIIPTMSEEEFTHTQNVLSAICMSVDQLDLTGFIKCLDEAMLIGESTDKGLYNESKHRLQQVKEVAAKLRELNDLTHEHASHDVVMAEQLKRQVEAIEAKHEEQSQTTAQPIIPSDPSFLLNFDPNKGDVPAED